MITTDQFTSIGELEASLTAAFERAEIIRVSRSRIPSLIKLLWGIPLLLVGLLLLLPLAWLANWGKQNGYEMWGQVNLVLALVPILIVLLSIPFGLLQYFNSYELRIRGVMRIGVEYVIDTAQGKFYEHRVGFFTNEYVGVNQANGKPRPSFGKWSYYYTIPEDITLLSDVRNPRTLPMKILEKWFDFGDVYVPSAQRGADNVILDAKNPTLVAQLLLAAQRTHSARNQGASS